MGEPLQLCSSRPVTGFFRNGCCDTGPRDRGSHTICVRVTADFLAYSRARGNDLSTPVPQFDFPGLQPGDQWCLCAARWVEAFEAGCAPHVVLQSTNEAALEICEFTDLAKYALDLN
jgi:uncharacterized protein (DUF2237 family)